MFWNFCFSAYRIYYLISSDIIPNNYHLEWAKRMEARYNNPYAYPDDQEIGEVVDLLNGKTDSKEQNMKL